MSLDEPTTGLPPNPAVTTDTFKVFLPGQRVYIQAANGDAPLLALAELATVLPNESRLQLRWLAQAALEGGEVKAGSQVRLSTGEKRMLYVANAEVIAVHAGVMTSAVVQVPARCSGYNRRRHPRYELFAAVKLGLAADEPTFVPAGPVAVDLSLGGFGLRMPDPNWPVEERLKYEINIETGQTGSGLSAVPAIRLQGEAVIRRRVSQPNGLVLLGCEFADMSGYRAHVLEFWLDTFNVYLRES